VLIEQWSTGRDVLVVLDGVATVQHDRRLVARVGPGDVVGELAALDWGAGYGALRAARVQAETPVRYLVLAADAFAELMRTSPAVRDLVERSRRERQRPA
jgi:CRP-like cAMP-binding protein